MFFRSIILYKFSDSCELTMEEDDGVQIDIVEDAKRHPDVLENTNPAFFVDIFNNITWLLQVYGWVVLIAAAITYWLWTSFYKPKLQMMQRDIREEEERKKTDNSSYVEREARVLAARERLQAKYDAELEQFKEEQAKKDEAKRQQKIDDWDRHLEGKGYRKKLANMEMTESTAAKVVESQNRKKPSQPLRPNDYNPLMGSSGAAGYRPSRRTGGNMGGG